MQRSILIVEDAETCSSILEILVSLIEDVRSITASSAVEAWDLLEHKPDGIRAIVTDLHMPGMDGFELIERVRSKRLLRKLPIIVITGCTDSDVLARVRVLGADAVFAKPYSPAVVREKLEQLLNNEKPCD